MAILKINYDQLKKLEKLPENIKGDVITKSMRSSITNSKETVAEYALKTLERSRFLKFDRKVQKRRITFGRITDGNRLDNISSYIRFSTINESISSFPWQKTSAYGTDGKKYQSFKAKVLGQSIRAMPKTFISKYKKWSVRRTGNTSYPLRKAYIEHSSISDLLRYKPEILEQITNRAKRKYESEIQRNLRWNLMKI